MGTKLRRFAHRASALPIGIACLWAAPAMTGPVPRGETAVGIWDQNSGTFFLADTLASGFVPSNRSFFMSLGGSQWIPLAGDWDGDGIDGAGIYDTTVTGFIPADIAVFINTGGPRYLPITGNWDGVVIHGVKGDGIGIWDSIEGLFHLANITTSSNGKVGIDISTSINRIPTSRISTFVPIAGNWNGVHGIDGIGVWDGSDGTFYLVNRARQGRSLVEVITFMNFGGSQWTPVAGSWDGQGTSDGIGIQDNTNGTWFVTNTIPCCFQRNFAPAEQSFFMHLGGTNWRPITGAWPLVP